MGTLTYSLSSDGSLFLVETIVSQMLSNKASDAITARLYELCGGNLITEKIMELDHLSIRSIGLSEQKVEYIKGIALHVNRHPGFFDELQDLDNEEIVKRLTRLRGIGSWSAKMYLIFVLNRLDVLPFEDGAFLQAYKWLYSEDDVKPSSIIEKCQSWRPYSSIAARYLYRALDSGLTRDAVLRDELRRLSR